MGWRLGAINAEKTRLFSRFRSYNIGRTQDVQQGEMFGVHTNIKTSAVNSKNLFSLDEIVGIYGLSMDLLSYINFYIRDQIFVNSSFAKLLFSNEDC